MKKQSLELMLRYFLQGLLLVAPIFITLYIIFKTLQWLDQLIPINIPGLGLILLLVAITTLGFLGSTILAKPLIGFLDKVVERIPLVNIIYSSLKDFVQAFAGEKKKFNQPVLITLNKDSQVQKFGFITENDLSHFNVLNKIAVRNK